MFLVAEEPEREMEERVSQAEADKQIDREVPTHTARHGKVCCFLHCAIRVTHVQLLQEEFYEDDQDQDGDE